MTVQRIGSAGLGVLLVVGFATTSCDDESETTPTGATTGTTTAGTSTGSGTSTGQGGGTSTGTGGTGGSAQGGGGNGGSGQGGQGTGGGCIPCSEVWLHDDDPGDLCTDGTTSSLDLFEALKTCGCDGTCTQCSNSICNDNAPSGACQGCLTTNCGGDVTACIDDT